MNGIDDSHRVGGSAVICKSISITLWSEGRKAGIGKRNFKKKKKKNRS